MSAARKKRQTGRQSSLLEQSVEALHMLGFQIYGSLGQFEKAQVVGDRYVIRNHPHTSLYLTAGKKEALIVARPSNGFIPDGGGWVRIVVEAKYQDTSGSVDEKLPYIWEAFLISEIPNWIVILDGRYWKSTRGKAAVTWLRAHQSPPGRWFQVTDRMGFVRLATEAWGAAA